MLLNFIVLGQILSLSLAWDYYGKGPDAWPYLYNDCNGEEQSPIDIQTNDALFDSSLPDIRYPNIEDLCYWNITNSKTVTLSPVIRAGSLPKLYGGRMNKSEAATLVQIHFHWGFNDYHGSEHLINGQKYPLEMHMVHATNSMKYNVLAFFFQLSQRDNPFLEQLLDSVNKSRFSSTNNHYAEFSISKLTQLDSKTKVRHNYFRYMGSLTTPPCSEGIVWTVLPNAINISSKQLQMVRGLGLNFNHRAPQPLKNRNVYSNFRINKTPSNHSSLIQKMREFINRVLNSIF